MRVERMLMPRAAQARRLLLWHLALTCLYSYSALPSSFGRANTFRVRVRCARCEGRRGGGCACVWVWAFGLRCVPRRAAALYQSWFVA